MRLTISLDAEGAIITRTRQTAGSVLHGAWQTEPTVHENISHGASFNKFLRRWPYETLAVAYPWSDLQSSVA